MTVPHVFNAGVVQRRPATEGAENSNVLEIGVPGIESCSLSETWAAEVEPFELLITAPLRELQGDFWTSVEIESLARAQGVRAFDMNVHVVPGIWDSDAEVDTFIAEVYDGRDESIEA